MFWQNFSTLCTQSGKSPSRVAEELGFTSAAVAGWKKGAEPRNNTLKQIADYFGVTVQTLTGEGAVSSPPSLEPDEVQLLADYRGFSYAGRGLVRDFIEKMKAAGIYAYGVDPMMLGFNSDS